MSPGRTRIDGDPRLCHRCTRPVDDWRKQTEQYSFISTMRFLRSVRGPNWRPRVHLSRGMPPAMVEMELLRGAVVDFDEGAWSITLPSSALRLPLPRLRGTAISEAEWNEWEASAPLRDFAGAVGQALTTILPTRNVGMQFVARWSGFSTRTFQRRLAEGGITFAYLVARARYRAAIELLRDEARTLQDVATALGYNHPAHFTRAFRRWTGTAPRQFRWLCADANRATLDESSSQRRLKHWRNMAIKRLHGRTRSG